MRVYQVILNRHIINRLIPEHKKRVHRAHRYLHVVALAPSHSMEFVNVPGLTKTRQQTKLSKPVIERGAKGSTRTCLHPNAQGSLMELSMPYATSRNHQKLATIANMTVTKRIFLVCSETRRAVETKWSSMCAAIRTAK